MFEKYRKFALASVAAICAIVLGFVGIHNSDREKEVVEQVQESDESKFAYAMETVIRHEGGLSDHPNDKGGVTKYGISLRYLSGEKIDANGDGSINKDDVIHLTRTDADKIYYKEWYIKHRYNEILNKYILTDIMDFSINAGATQCHKTLKRAINRIISDPIEVDGDFDDDTIEIVNLIEPVVLHEALNQEQDAFYRGLVKKKPNLGVFLNGWLKRSRD